MILVYVNFFEAGSNSKCFNLLACNHYAFIYVDTKIASKWRIAMLIRYEWRKKIVIDNDNARKVVK